MTGAGTWMTELASMVRLYGQGTATRDDVLGLLTHIWSTDGDASEPQGRFVVRQLVNVIGQATVDQDQAVFDSAKRLVDECPEADRRANSADEIIKAFAEVGQSDVAVRAVRDAHRRHFGT
jgi:hypothetical protein